MSGPRQFAIALCAMLPVLAACERSNAARPAASPNAFVMTAAYARQVAAIGHRLEAQDRARDARQRAQMARVVDARILQTKDDADGLAFLLAVRNKSPKTIRTLGEGLEIRERGGHRIGLLEIDDAAVHVAPRGSAQLWQHERYTRFGDETGDVRLAKGKPKFTSVRVLDIGYADGSGVDGGD